MNTQKPEKESQATTSSDGNDVFENILITLTST
jgi:hypothetical protein